MNPAFLAFLLKNQLVIRKVLCHPEVPLAKFWSVVDTDIGGLTGDVLGVGGPTHSAVEFRAAVARGDDHRLANVLAKGFKDSLAEIAKDGDEFRRYGIVDVATDCSD